MVARERPLAGAELPIIVGQFRVPYRPVFLKSISSAATFPPISKLFVFKARTKHQRKLPYTQWRPMSNGKWTPGGKSRRGCKLRAGLTGCGNIDTQADRRD
jgi:hypothetical protein